MSPETWLSSWLFPSLPDFDYYPAHSVELAFGYFGALPREIQRHILSFVMRKKKIVVLLPQVCTSWKRMFYELLQEKQVLLRKDVDDLWRKTEWFLWYCLDDVKPKHPGGSVPTVLIETSLDIIILSNKNYTVFTSGQEYFFNSRRDLARQNLVTCMRHIIFVNFPILLEHKTPSRNHPLLYLTQEDPDAVRRLSISELHQLFMEDIEFYKRARMLFMS